ncbi:MAG: hypothetical protein D6717_12045 [Gammaproteobacteria bacterium]|nr:MAG: hypothetical protein D6717_12045 [Gammaproteobacteria bacterium]
MADKNELIKEMLEMQKKFQEYERQQGIDPEEYYMPGDDSPLNGYRERYHELAAQVRELASEEVNFWK